MLSIYLNSYSELIILAVKMMGLQLHHTTLLLLPNWNDSSISNTEKLQSWMLTVFCFDHIKVNQDGV